MEEEIKRSLPELPDARRKRYVNEYGLPGHDAFILTSSKALADFFEEAAGKCNNAKAVSNFILGDVSRILNDKGMEAEDIPFPAEYLAKLVKLVDQGTISTTIAKKVLEIMFEQKRIRRR